MLLLYLNIVQQPCAICCYAWGMIHVYAINVICNRGHYNELNWLQDFCPPG